MQWDYSKLAKSYSKRAPYSKKALDKMCKFLKNSKTICDIGAGTGFLSKELTNRGFLVTAMEPNDEMRKYGKEFTKDSNVIWKKGNAERTSENDHIFDAVTYGSSFNVVDKQKALSEALRIVKLEGFFACMWNHRDLHDPIQKEIEIIIKNNILEYSYGDRRVDQLNILKESKLFSDINFISHRFIFKHKLIDVIEAWKSHGTLFNQAKDKFLSVISQIESYLNSLKISIIEIPYETKIWVAKFK